MGDHGKRKPDPRPVDLSEPGAVIPPWYWRISPRAHLWTPIDPESCSRPRRRSPALPMLLALVGATMRR